jgi:hypothetical protein
MATAWIREYSLVEWSRGRTPDREVNPVDIPVAAEPGTDQTVTFTTTTQSTAFAADTSYIAITSSVPFHYKVGSNPTATTGSLRVAADVILHVGVKPGDKVAFVTAS